MKYVVSFFCHSSSNCSVFYLYRTSSASFYSTPCRAHVSVIKSINITVILLYFSKSKCILDLLITTHNYTILFIKWTYWLFPETWKKSFSQTTITKIWLGSLALNKSIPTHAFSSSLLTPATKLGQGYVFTGVCDSVYRGCMPQCMLGYHTHPPGADPPPRSRHSPGTDPPKQTPPRSRHSTWEQTPPRVDTPWEQTLPGADTPRADTPWHRACWNIRSMRGRYASYYNWNLFMIETDLSAVCSGKQYLKNRLRIS